MKFNKLLVTGGAGFIGSYLCKKLAEADKEIIIFDNGFRVGFKNYEEKKNIKLIKGDIRNLNDWKKIPYDIDFVYHLGAINGTKYFYEDPTGVLEVNIEGVINMLNWISNTKAQGFFFASSSEIYGYPKNFPTAETEDMCIPDPKNPRFSYSSSKIVGEILSINFAKKLGIPYHIGRFHNVYGPSMGFEHVIPEFIKRVVKGERFVVQGNGEESRSFCFIDDAVNAIEIICKKEGKNDIFNIGTQEEITINHLIKLIEKISKKEINPIYESFSNSGTNRRVPDISKIKYLGYKPKICIEEGLKNTYEWYENWWTKN